MADVEKTDEEIQKDAEEFSLDGINPEELDPELKSIYKHMQAGFTKKTQAIAEERRGMDDERTRYKDDLQNLGGMETELKQWRDWYKNLEDQVSTDGQQTPGEKQMDTTGTTTQDTDTTTQGVDYTSEDPQVSKQMTQMQAEISRLGGELNSAHAAIKESGDKFTRMFDYQSQLGELSSDHPEMDRDKLLDHALANGQTDLKKAYQDLYREEIIQAEVKQGVEEELARQRTVGITSGAKQIIVRAGEKTPKSWDEATEQILKQRAVDGTLA